MPRPAEARPAEARPAQAEPAQAEPAQAEPAQADLASDLAYVRSLAEEGAHAPLVSGRYFVVWGGLMAAASLLVYLNAVGVTNFGNAGFMAPWFVALAAGWIVSYVMRKDVSGKPGAATLGNKTAGSVWYAVGLFMTFFFGALLFAHGNYESLGIPEYFLFSFLYPIGFGLYGVSFWATSTAARVSWLKYFALASWAFSGLLLFFLATSHLFLIGALGLAVCALTPGIILMRREPAMIV